jgi:thioredoxin reductase (NADPH)
VDTDVTYDLIIIGAGPIGISAACAAQEQGLRYLLLDKGGLCQTLSEFAPRQSFYSPADELEVGNIPFPVAADEKPRREDAIAYYRGVVSNKKINLSTWERVIRLSLSDGLLHIDTLQEPDQAWSKSYTSKTVLLTTGVWDQPRRLDVPGANLKKVSVRYVDPTPYYSKDCLVVGGGNSAAEVAMALARAGASTTMALTEGSFDACQLRPFVLRELLLMVDENKIKPYFNTSVDSICPAEVILKNAEKTWPLKNDFIFTMIGNIPDVPFLLNAGIEVSPDDNKPIYNEETFETNVPGIYVAGSISREPHIFNGRLRAVEIVKTIARTL